MRYMGLRVRRAIRARDINLGVISVWMILKGVRLNEITQGRSADREKKRSEDWASDMSTFRGSEESEDLAIKVKKEGQRGREETRRAWCHRTK